MGLLSVIATPIGNLEDITLRALRTLREADVLVCEDTRHTRIILDRYEIKPPGTVFSCHEFNETRQVDRILGLLAAGSNVAFCSDAGYPLVSDPGYRVVSGALAAGHEVDVIPGPGAVPTALVISGLSVASYTFKGFPPRKSGQRQNYFAMERDLPHTIVLFESPRRVGATLADAYAVLGNRKAAVCIELTKKFQTVRRDSLQKLAEEFKGEIIRGEVTIVISGNNRKFLVEEGEDATDEPLPSPVP